MGYGRRRWSATTTPIATSPAQQNALTMTVCTSNVSHGIRLDPPPNATRHYHTVECFGFAQEARPPGQPEPASQCEVKKVITEWRQHEKSRKALFALPYRSPPLSTAHRQPAKGHGRSVGGDSSEGARRDAERVDILQSWDESVPDAVQRANRCDGEWDRHVNEWAALRFTVYRQLCELHALSRPSGQQERDTEGDDRDEAWIEELYKGNAKQFSSLDRLAGGLFSGGHDNGHRDMTPFATPFFFSPTSCTLSPRPMLLSLPLRCQQPSSLSASPTSPPMRCVAEGQEQKTVNPPFAPISAAEGAFDELQGDEAWEIADDHPGAGPVAGSEGDDSQRARQTTGISVPSVQVPDAWEDIEVMDEPTPSHVDGNRGHPDAPHSNELPLPSCRRSPRSQCAATSSTEPQPPASSVWPHHAPLALGHINSRSRARQSPPLGEATSPPLFSSAHTATHAGLSSTGTFLDLGAAPGGFSSQLCRWGWRGIGVSMPVEQGGLPMLFTPSGDPEKYRVIYDDLVGGALEGGEDPLGIASRPPILRSSNRGEQPHACFSLVVMGAGWEEGWGGDTQWGASSPLLLLAQLYLALTYLTGEAFAVALHAPSPTDLERQQMRDFCRALLVRAASYRQEQITGFLRPWWLDAHRLPDSDAVVASHLPLPPHVTVKHLCAFVEALAGDLKPLWSKQVAALKASFNLASSSAGHKQSAPHSTPSEAATPREWWPVKRGRRMRPGQWKPGRNAQFQQ
ncbi:unnamed protein product [Vitrella brassicaformis CCMP3155]|uniref:Ribosomal RNA methyltransferase FtsJ domain-containing protein n=1 Tax=Vitrella brassicaformis (strain CCMP3155) TaxID=1169540 RepID=A0A0G4F8V5_VITBC|nr:unnamed protein product [Vitrella brassicaformis CCMP3155]|eukprot:CEM08782.1 unnamed protein product [Vitrella brassicaformis CCMP3155]